MRQEEHKNCVYFMLVTSPHCHDMDEWVGVYDDINKLQEDYEKAKVALTPENGYKGLNIEIYEFKLNEFFMPGETDGGPRHIKTKEDLSLIERAVD